jgi:GT2 family glycosyltransferase
VPPPASILLPTRRRRDYLQVALASVAPQARTHGAEMIVVEDDPADPETARLAAVHGARYVAHGAPRGLNRARNTALEAAGGELLCFLDDDVEVWPGWLEALLRAARDHPDHDAFGGPIRARLEGGRLRTCGREPPPVTTLDLGPQDVEAELVWGANLALRRRALERVGTFDPARSGPGDEEEWERRLRAAGGRILYVAAAGVDHRRAGADARLPALARAAYRRGRASRRYDAEKCGAPSPARELRTLAGCLWHAGRRRCGTGLVLAAHTAGRLQEVMNGGDETAVGRRDEMAPGAPATADGDPDWLSGRSGTLGRRALLTARARDLAADVRTLRQRGTLRRTAGHEPPRRRVHVAGVARAEHAATTARLRRELERSRHDVTVDLVPGAPGAGKWANLRAALAALPPAGADWLLLVDDDVVLPRGFLDAFLCAAERAGLRVAQPAHAYASHAAWPVTRRRPGLLARRTRFVEIGPVTALHADAFDVLLPLPELAMGWGLDAHWSAAAAAAGLPIGVVDATPIRHLRPVATDYPRAAAIAEGARFLAGRPYVTRTEAEAVLDAWR